MVYTFARVGAAVAMSVEDFYVQGRRHWVRLAEKGGKEIAMPCHHNLESYLSEYVSATDLAEEPKTPLFRSARGKTGQPLGIQLLTSHSLDPFARPGDRLETPVTQPASAENHRFDPSRAQPLEAQLALLFHR